MSVEEAWRNIAQWLNAREFACLDGEHTDAMRDRLILEVQAEMPCYFFAGDPPRDENIAVTCLCPVHQAREKLGVPV